MGIWAPINREEAEARMKELRPHIHDCPDARGEYRILTVLLSAYADTHPDIIRWRSRLH